MHFSLDCITRKTLINNNFLHDIDIDSSKEPLNKPILVLRQAAVAHLAVAKHLLHIGKDVFHLGPHTGLSLLLAILMGLPFLHSTVPCIISPDTDFLSVEQLF